MQCLPRGDPTVAFLPPMRTTTASTPYPTEPRSVAPDPCSLEWQIHSTHPVAHPPLHGPHPRQLLVQTRKRVLKAHNDLLMRTRLGHNSKASIIYPAIARTRIVRHNLRSLRVLKEQIMLMLMGMRRRDLPRRQGRLVRMRMRVPVLLCLRDHHLPPSPLWTLY